MKSIVFILVINIIIGITIVATQSPSKKNSECFQETTFSCCDGFVLQVQNETTATCVKCLKPGEPCYQVNRPCCSGYRCGSGGAVYPEPRSGDHCISNQIIG